MDTLLSLKHKVDDFEVEYDILTPLDMLGNLDERQRKIIIELQSIDKQIEINKKKIDEINSQIDHLTNHADGLDYMVAVASGVLTGTMDSFFVGEFDFNRGMEWSNEKVNEFVTKTANKLRVKEGLKNAKEKAKEKGKELSKEQLEAIKKNIENKKLDLKQSIRYMEDRYKVPTDNIWKFKGSTITPETHHLDDLSHHPSIIGLIASIITQFTLTGYFQDGNGDFIKIKVDEHGIKFIGNDFKSKVFCGTVNWFFHLVSDMAGTGKRAGAGMGIPGPVMSLAKELSMLPGLNQTSLSKKLEEVFTEYRFDLRSELAVAHELGRQSIPVILNEVLVRFFYFIRRLILEYKEKRSFKKIEWRNTLPFKNRTIVRMMTIATGTFTAIDMADGAIRSAAKSGGITPAFLGNFILHVNFVGIGRFAIACTSDVKLGMKRSKLRNERIALYNEQLFLTGAKVFYKQADMWIAAESAEQTIEEAYDRMEKTTDCLVESIQEIREDMKNISSYVPTIKEHNSGLLQDINDILTWG